MIFDIFSKNPTPSLPKCGGKRVKSAYPRGCYHSKIPLWKGVQMYRVETNKYSHSSSAATRVLSRHETLEEAIAAAESLWQAKTQRWVNVYHGNVLHFHNGKISAAPVNN